MLHTRCQRPAAQSRQGRVGNRPNSRLIGPDAKLVHARPPRVKGLCLALCLAVLGLVEPPECMGCRPGANLTRCGSWTCSKVPAKTMPHVRRCRGPQWSSPGSVAEPTLQPRDANTKAFDATARGHCALAPTHSSTMGSAHSHSGVTSGGPRAPAAPHPCPNAGHPPVSCTQPRRRWPPGTPSQPALRSCPLHQPDPQILKAAACSRHRAQRQQPWHLHPHLATPCSTHP